MRPELDYRSYFGSPDESDDALSDARMKHITLSVEDQLKTGTKSDGDQIVVAPKGFGKTNLRMAVQADKDGSVVSVFSENDQKFTFKASELQGGSGIGKDAIAVVLLSSVIRRISQNGGLKDNALGKLKTIYENIGVVVSETEINALVNIPIGKIFSGASSGFESSKLDELVALVVSQLKDKNSYILIDDFDDIFVGAYDHPVAVEALCRAISFLNAKCKQKIHILGFMKRGLYKKLYENRRDFDKIGSVFCDISWDKDCLVELISARIRHFNHNNAKDLNNKSDYNVWKAEFNIKNKYQFNDLTKYLWETTRSNPRDVIQLLNLSKKRAPKKIAIQDIKAVLTDFSSDKFQNMKSEYVSVFPGAFDFAKSVLSSMVPTWDYAALIKRVEAIVDDTDALSRTIRNEDWFDERDNVDRVQILFDIGVLGKIIDGQIYFVSDVPLDEASSVEHCQLAVHPALLPYLKIS